MDKDIFIAALHKEEFYVVECLGVGTVIRGHIVEEAISNLKESTEPYLKEYLLPNISCSILTTFEVVNTQTKKDVW